MYKFLINLFIKDKDNITSPSVRSRYGAFCGIIGIITNLIISFVKIVSGFFSGSIAITADGINSLTDGASSIITLIAFKLSNAPADPEHPFGHERLEYVSGLIVSIVILLIGAFLAESSINKIIHPVIQDHSNFYLLIGVLVFSIFVKIWQALVYKKTGKLINSQALMASSFDSLTDIASTSAVLLSFLISYIFHINIDGYIGLAVSLFIVFSGIKLIKETISPLLGEAPNEDFVKKVTSKLSSYPGVLGHHDLVIHSYGASKVFITVHIEVDANIDVSISHDLIDNIEQDFLKDNLNLVIHLDPINMQDEYAKKLKSKVEKIINSIDSELDFHDFRIVKGPIHTNVLFDIVIPPKYPISDEDLKERITNDIKKINSKFNVIIILDHNYLK